MAEVVLPSAAVREGEVVVVSVDGVEVGIVRTNGSLRAFENRCPHQGGPVCYGEIMPEVEGVLDDRGRYVGRRFSPHKLNLFCPWHGWAFDVLTGECIVDRRFRLRRWDVTEDGGFIRLSPRRRSRGGEEGTDRVKGRD